MGPDTHHIDFLHEYKEQPHASRRIEILSKHQCICQAFGCKSVKNHIANEYICLTEKHPEIKQLMLANGDFRQVLISLAACILQLTLAFISMSEHLPVLVKVMNNFILGSISGSLIFLNIHEAAHGLLFGPAHPKLNKLMGMILNLFYGIPTYTFFKKHHLDHHKYQGDKDFDIEYPTQLEIKIFNWSPFMRLVWLQFNATFMQIRGYFLGPRKIDLDDIINISTVLLVDIWLIQSGYFWIFSFLLGSAFAATGMGLIGTWGLIVHTVYFKEVMFSFKSQLKC